MKATAAQFVGAGHPLELVELPIPELEPGAILVEIELAAVCGSDLHTISGARSEQIPCTMGHEGVGRVVDSRRSGTLPGDRLTWSLADSCGECSRCQSGLVQKCTDLFKYGHGASGLDGTYATHVVLRPGTEVRPIPSDLELKAAAVLNCALATGAAAGRGAKGRVMVLGAGMLGLFAAHLAIRQGADVVIVDSSESRRNLASAAGFLTSAAPGDEVDLVIEAAGSAAALHSAYPYLRPGGEIRLVGLVHPDSPLNLTAEDIIRRCWTIRGLHNYGPLDLDLAMDHALDFQKRIPADAWGPIFPLSQIQEALAGAQQRASLRVFISPGT